MFLRPHGGFHLELVFAFGIAVFLELCLCPFPCPEPLLDLPRDLPFTFPFPLPPGFDERRGGNNWEGISSNSGIHQCPSCLREGERGILVLWILMRQERVLLGQCSFTRGPPATVFIHIPLWGMALYSSGGGLTSSSPG